VLEKCGQKGKFFRRQKFALLLQGSQFKEQIEVRGKINQPAILNKEIITWLR